MHRRLISIAVIGALTACSSVSETQKATKSDLKTWSDKVSDINDPKINKPKTVERVKASYANAQKIKFSPENEWLKSKSVTINMTGKSMSLNAIIQELSEQGLNVTSTLPVNTYYYTGYSIHALNADEALKLILENIGLDYSADATSKVVIIKPMTTKTWKFNIGNRQASFGTGKVNTINPLSSASGSSSGGGSSSSSSSSSSSGGGGSLPSVSNSTVNDGDAGIVASDNFWGSLKEELNQRLIKIVPNGKALGNATTSPMGVGPVPTSSSGTAGASSSGSTTELFGDYSKKSMGYAVINSEIGTVSVQAPHWILEELDKHFEYINEMYSSRITFEGQIVLLSTDNIDSEGVDIYKFAQYASNKYGLTFSTNATGGVTLKPPTVDIIGGNVTPGTVNSVNPSIANTMLGVYSDSFAVFNNYLSSFGTINVLQKPIMSTSTGVPNTFSKTTPYYFNTTSETTTAGNTGAATVAKTNTLNVVEYGTVLKIYPRYNPKTGIVSAQYVLNQNVLSNETEINQPTSSSTPNKVTIPIITKLKYEGEIMLKPNELAIIGGQSEDNSRASGSGLAGTTETVARGLFGTAKNQQTKNIYYFLLKVKVEKKY